VEEVRKFDLHQAEYSRACRGKQRFFDAIIQQMPVNNICNNLCGKGNFENVIKTQLKEGMQDIFNVFLVLKLAEK